MDDPALIFGNYRALEPLARGGFGQVYRGEHRYLTQRVVAIKVMRDASLRTPEERDAFLHEANILELLKHSSILPILDVGLQEDVPYLVTEYAPAGSLHQRLQKHQGQLLPLDEALSILRQIAEALHFAHEHQVIHRDLKPDNILFNGRGEALLADFGIATLLHTASFHQTKIIGTPAYMAPEQFKGQVCKESDQYALACLAYELFTGYTPFGNTGQTLDFFTLMFHHLNEQPLPPTQSNPTLPAYLSTAILKALAKERTERYPDVLAFVEALLLSPSSTALAPRHSATSPMQSTSLTQTRPAQARGIELTQLAQPNEADLRERPAQVPERASQVPPPGTRLLVYRGHSDGYTCGLWSPDGTRFALGGTSGVVQVRDARTDTLLWTCDTYFSEVSALAWSPDGIWLASGSSDKTVRVWEASSGRKLLTYSGHTNYVSALAWSPDGSRLASGSWDKTAQVWEASSGRKLLTYSGHAQSVSALAWSPDGSRLASGSWDKIAQVWEASNGHELLTYSGHTDYVNGLAWSPDGKRLASGSQDKTVQVWEASSGRKLLTYSGHARSVNALAWSPDGNRLASGSGDRTVQVWEASSGRELLTYSGHTNAVRALAWSPDGSRLTSGSAGDRTVQVWEVNSGRQLLTYSGHTDPVHTLAWSPDGKRLASGSADKTVQVWEVNSGRELLIYSGHAQSVFALAWSPDGKRLASGSRDGIVQVWQAV